MDTEDNYMPQDLVIQEMQASQQVRLSTSSYRRAMGR